MTTQPAPQEPPIVPPPHIAAEHTAFRESRRISKQTSTVWYGDEPELRTKRDSKQSRMSSDVRRSLSRKRSLSKKKVKEPEEPKRVCISPILELPPFRPLHLSIHLPGGELPKLPKFSDDPEEEDEIPPVPEIPRPPQAVLLEKPETTIKRTASRKTIATAKSFDNGRISTDTELTMVEVSWRPRTSSLSYQRMRSPSSASARSNQDFVEMLNNPLPPLPKQLIIKPTSKPTSKKGSQENMKQLLSKPVSKKSSRENLKTEEKPTLVRSASDQNKRLQTHLQEREQVDIGSPDCSTIAEERSPSVVSPKHSRRRSSSCPAPPRLKGEANAAVTGLGLIPAVSTAGILSTAELTSAPAPLDIAPKAPQTSATITDFTSLDPLPAMMPVDDEPLPAAGFPGTLTRARSSSGTSTLLNTPDILSSRPPTAADDLVKPALAANTIATVTALNLHNNDNAKERAFNAKLDLGLNEKPSMSVVGARLTQWLTRSKSLSRESMRPYETDFNANERSESGQSWFDNRDSALILSTSAPAPNTGNAFAIENEHDKTDEERRGEKEMFRVSALAKEIGLGELLDAKLGITHPEEKTGLVVGEKEVKCGITRSRSATESTIVGTERGPSLDLMRKVIGVGGGMEAEVTVGMAM